jgi:hypothetical protein
MTRLLSLDVLAPEVRRSRGSAMMTAGAALLVLLLLVAGVSIALVLDVARGGTSHVRFHSTEPFGRAPGARAVYIAEKETYVLRGWLGPTLGPAGVYQVWAVQDGRYRSLATADADPFVGLTVSGEADLDGVERILITREPPGGSFPAPKGPAVAELLPLP